jgi:hypothetical protein
VDEDAEQKYGETATAPDFDIHIRTLTKEVEVIIWWRGKRYHGKLKEDK